MADASTPAYDVTDEDWQVDVSRSLYPCIYLGDDRDQIPIFRLRHSYDDRHERATLAAAAPLLLKELIAARRWIIEAVSSNVELEGFDPAEHVSVKRIDAAIAHATKPKEGRS